MTINKEPYTEILPTKEIEPVLRGVKNGNPESPDEPDLVFRTHDSTAGIDTDDGNFRIIDFARAVLVVRRLDGCVVCIAYSLKHAIESIYTNKDDFLKSNGITIMDEKP